MSSTSDSKGFCNPSNTESPLALSNIESQLVELASRGLLPSCCPVSPDSSSSLANNIEGSSESGQTILTAYSMEEGGNGGSGMVSVSSDSSGVSTQVPSLPTSVNNHGFAPLPLTSTNSLVNLPSGHLSGEVSSLGSSTATSELLIPRANSTVNPTCHNGLTSAKVPGLGLSLHMSAATGGSNSAFHAFGELEVKRSMQQHPFGFTAAGCKRPLSGNISLPPSLSGNPTHRLGMEMKSPLVENALFQPPDGQDFNARVQAAALAAAVQIQREQHNQHSGPVAAARLGMMGCTPANLFNMMQAVAANNFLLRQQQAAAASKQQESSNNSCSSSFPPVASGMVAPPAPSLMSNFLQQLQAIGGHSNGGHANPNPQFMPHSYSPAAAANSFEFGKLAAGSPACNVGDSFSTSSHPTSTANNNDNQARLCRDFLTATASIPSTNGLGVGSRSLNTNNGSNSTTASIASNASVNGDLCGVELCVVCGDKASGRHYGAISCEGCKGFFKRSIRKQTLKNQILQIAYVCRGAKDCPVTKFHRNRCQFCRLRKCLSMGMKSESVQAERRPMNAALAAAAAVCVAAANTSPTSSNGHNSNKYAKMNNGMAMGRNGSDESTGSNGTTLCRSASVASSVASNHHRFERISPPDLSSNHYLQQGLLAIVQQQHQHNHQASSSTSVSDFILQLNNTNNNQVNGNTCSETMHSSSSTSNPASKVKLERKYSSDATSTTTTTLDICNGVIPTSTSVSPTTPLSPSAPTTQITCKTEASNCQHEEFDPECCCNLAATTSSAAPSPVSSGDGHGRGLSQQFSEDEPTSPTSSSSSLGSVFPMFNPECAKFELPIPQPQPQELNIQFICETASRLLFLSVHWIKNVRSLAAKPFYMECTMKLKWCDLFVLGLMQCADEFNLPNMLHAMNNHLGTCAKFGQLKPEKYEEVNKQISYLLALVRRIRHLKLTSLEFAYLKTIAFTANDLPEPLMALVSPNNTSNGHCPKTQLQLQQQQYGRQLNGQACQELYEHILGTLRANNTLDNQGRQPTEEQMGTDGLHDVTANNLKKEDEGVEGKTLRGFNEEKDSRFEQEDKHSGSSNSSSHSPSSIRSENVLSTNNSEEKDASKQASSQSSTDKALNAPTPILLAALDRHSQLLQVLPCLRWFKQSVLVELFFSGLIGSLSIETVMPFILGMDVMQIFDKTNPTAQNGAASRLSGCSIGSTSGRNLQQQSLLALATAAGTSIKNF